MKIKIYTPIFILIISISVNAQDLNKTERIQIFTEEFVDNANNWAGIGITDKQGTATILESNSCEIKATNGNSMVIVNEWPIDTERDFEITCRFRFKDYSSDALNSLVSFSWGCSFDNMHQYSFGCAPSKLVVVRKLTNDLVELLPATSITDFRQEDFNQIIIKKENNSYTFFFNNQVLGKSPFQPFFGDGLFLTVGSGLTVLFDHLSINYLTPKMKIKRLPRLALDPPFTTANKITTEDGDFSISGMAIDEDGIASFSVNGTNMAHDNGKFLHQSPLIIGNNLFKIEVVDNSGQRTIKYLEIERTEAKEKLLVGQKRLALVIGNSKYIHAAELRNPAQDAKDMAKLLKNMGFDVLFYPDLDYASFINALREYGSKINEYDMTLVFYAGHGIQVDDKNYLIPVDAKLDSKNDIEFETVEVEKIINIMANTDDDNLNLLILDACRNNPFRSWTRGGPEGLAGIQPPSGILVAYSTSPGAYASDGLGNNGLYTEELMQQLQISQRVEDIFINTRIAVERRSGGSQSPWELARLRGKYYLK